MIAPWQLPEALFNHLTFALRQTLRWQRGGYREKADDPGAFIASHPRRPRLEALMATYRPALADRFATSLIEENLDVLHLLDSARQRTPWQAPQRIVALDVGAKNFYYAPALHAFWSALAPLDGLTAVEVDAYQVYRDGYSRIDYAEAYAAGLAGTRFVAKDIRHYPEPADAVTMLFPFVTPLPLLKWGLPVSLLAPEAILDHVWRLLRPGGLLIVANQTSEEAAIQLSLCQGLEIPVSAHWHHADPLITGRPERFLTTAVKPG